MKTVSMANPAGKFSGLVLTAPADVIERSTPSGHLAVPGRHDPCTRRAQIAADVAGPECVAVVAVVPPRPADTELATWAWDAAEERWQPVATDAAVAADVRAERRRRIDALAWRYERHARELRAGRATTDDIAALDNLVQQLADITEQLGFPRNVIWPESNL